MKYDDALAVAIATARAAGDLLRADLARPGGPRGEGSHADVDEEAERLIRARLLAAFPWRYRGEETGFDLTADDDHIWVVDPNDGTRGFIKGFRGSAVSIGALRGGVPILGVVFAFAFPDDDGDLIAWAEGTGPITRNGKPVSTDLRGRALTPNDIAMVANEAEIDIPGQVRCADPCRFMPVPSIAYRLARVAAGDGIAALAYGWTQEWDFAAGHALIAAAGGILADRNGKPVTYTAEGANKVERLCAGAPAAVEAFHARPWSKLGQRKPDDSPFPILHATPHYRGTDTTRLNRGQGCLLGQAIGDSLGALVEFKKKEEIAAAHPNRARDLTDGGPFDIIAGQPTDDTEMALMLARSILKARAYEPKAAFSAYTEWYGSQPFTIGNTTARALSGKQASDRESQANGSLMRVAPIGVFMAGRPKEAAALARSDSDLTHPHPICREACAAFVAAIAAAIGGENRKACFAVALEEASRDPAAEAVRRAIIEAPRNPPTDFTAHQGWVLIALQNAFFRLLNSRSAEAGIIETVAEGGDTDTNAAIAGALLGAYYGRATLPWRWINAVLTCRPLAESGAAKPRPRLYWPVDTLSIAEELLTLGAATKGK